MTSNRLVEDLRRLLAVWPMLLSSTVHRLISEVMTKKNLVTVQVGTMIVDPVTIRLDQPIIDHQEPSPCGFGCRMASASQSGNYRVRSK